MILCILNFVLVSWSGERKALFIAGKSTHCEFSISEHAFLNSEDLSLFEFISEPNMSYFYMYLCVFNKGDSKKMQGWPHKRVMRINGFKY